MNALSAARAYLAKLPPALSGAGGHAATFHAACCLVRFGLSGADSLILLREWNGSHCRPPWKEKDLTHKLKDAQRVAGCEGRTLTPKPAVRVTWKVERKTPKSVVPVQPPAGATPARELLPHVTPSGDLIIPFNSPVRFHWWKQGGMTPTETRRFLLNLTSRRA